MSKPKADFFTRFTTATSVALGRPWVFVVALAVLLLWATSGPIMGFSDTWQLIINTSTTIITFLMVFIIQNTQNRDNLAMNIKLDAMMEQLGITHEKLLDAEDRSDAILEKQKARQVKRASHKKHKK